VVADSLRAAASRIVTLHPEVFETLYHVVTDKRRGADRGWLRPRRVFPGARRWDTRTAGAQHRGSARV